MAKGMKITIENKLIVEKRDISIYHYSSGSANLVSYNSHVEHPLRPDSEDDYLHISITPGPGHLKNETLVKMPSWINFECSSEGKITFSHSAGLHILHIPPGPPVWQLKITRSQTDSLHREFAGGRIIIANN